MQPITNNQCTNNTIMKQISKDELFVKIVKALKPLNPVKIIVFGSYAYGKPNENSDIDICVVEKDYKNKWEEKRKIDELLEFIDIPKDILNPKVEEYEFYKKEHGSVYKDIEDRGIVLWSS